MAFVGSEGPCYFDRALLHTSTWRGGSNINRFKDYLLLEVIVNKIYDEASQKRGDPDLPDTGSNRAEKQVISYFDRRYAGWRNLYCSFGPRSTDIQRADIIHGNSNGRNLAQWLGYSWARYVFVRFDQTDVKLKTYTRNNSIFRMREYDDDDEHPINNTSEEATSKMQTIKEPDVPEQTRAFTPSFAVGELNIEQDEEYGLGFQPTWTARFDIKQLALILHVPMQHRLPEFQSSYDFIALFESKQGFIKFDDAVSNHEGIRMKEEKTEADESWLKNIVTSLIQDGLGLIPYVRPFLSLGFEAVSEYLDNPEGWGKKQGLELSTEASAEMVKSATEILKYYNKDKVPHIEEVETELDHEDLYYGKKTGIVAEK
ncbi:hypothetical protein BDV19DRAFT_393551 [Aspergillus venezuelensis]